MTNVSHAQPIQLGRPFVHPLFDVALIGGGLSLVLVGALQLSDEWARDFPGPYLPVLVLVFNLAHFGASTVRLYTKPGTFHDLPTLTLWSPLLSLLVLTVAVMWSSVLGRHLNALYLTWSPYHYAAQTYGLTAMYAMRSQQRLADNEQNLLWWTCLFPFLYASVKSTRAGITWLLPEAVLADATFDQVRSVLEISAATLTFVVPALLAWRLSRRGSGLPVIGWLLVFSNGIWWVYFPYLQAFVWATIFHGVQYLAIVSIFHVRDHAHDGNGWLLLTLKFYAASLALGYLLFEIWPYTYVLAGYTLAESMLLCTAVINIHHFIVDRGIWRLRRDPNLRLVVEAAA